MLLIINNVQHMAEIDAKQYNVVHDSTETKTELPFPMSSISNTLG